MDQAIRSALDKYHGKTGNSAASTRPSRAAVAIITVLVLLAGFALCVKYDLLYADKAWQALSSVSIGSKTIGEIAAQFTGGAEQTPQTDDTAPVNSTGESGQIETSQTVSGIGARYLNYIKSRLNVAVPLEGTVTCSFGSRIHPVTGEESFHTGMDIAADEGTAVAAYQGGTVLETGRNDTYGNYILLDHTGRQTFYGHLSAVGVEEGQTVSAGETIGKVGSTGLSTGPHLHFEMRVDGERVDPANYIDVAV